MALTKNQRRISVFFLVFSLLLHVTTILHVKAHNHKPHNNNNNNNNNGNKGQPQAWGQSFIELNPNYVPSPQSRQAMRLRQLYQEQQKTIRNNNGHGLFHQTNKFDVIDDIDDDDFEQVQFSSYAAVAGSEPPPRARSQSLSYATMGILSLARDWSSLYPSLAASCAVCVSIFVAWQIPSCGAFLQHWFVASRANLQHGRWLSLFLSAFSHAGFVHIALNLLTLWSFGPAVQKSLQSWPLWPLIFGSTLAGSSVFLVWQALAGRSSLSGCMGLSAVTCALVTVFGRLHPQSQLRMLIFGVIPLQMTAQLLWIVLLVIATVSMVGAQFGTSRSSSNVAHAAHLGGILFGLAYHAIWKRRGTWRKVSLWNQ